MPNVEVCDSPPLTQLNASEALFSSLQCVQSACMESRNKQEHHRQNLDCVKAVILKDHTIKAEDGAGQGRAV